LEQLTKLKDPLVKLEAYIDWNIFAPILAVVFGKPEKSTKKNKMNFYGYKSHSKADNGTKLIRDYMATDASVHDSQELEILIDKSDAGQKLYADAVYIGQEAIIDHCGMTNAVH